MLPELLQVLVQRLTRRVLLTRGSHWQIDVRHRAAVRGRSLAVRAFSPSVGGGSGWSSVTAIRPGRPARGRRLPSGCEEQTERREQDEGGNRPAKDLETHRATSLSGFNRFVEPTPLVTARSRRRTTRSSTRPAGRRRRRLRSTSSAMSRSSRPRSHEPTCRESSTTAAVPASRSFWAAAGPVSAFMRPDPRLVSGAACSTRRRDHLDRKTGRLRGTVEREPGRARLVPSAPAITGTRRAHPSPEAGAPARFGRVTFFWLRSPVA